MIIINQLMGCKMAVTTFFIEECMKKYNKIVRDKIPEIIQKDSSTCEVSFVDNKTAINYLVDKLSEEALEFKESNFSKEELADLYEVLDSIKNKLKIKDSQLTQIRRRKGKINGVFENNIILKSVEKIK